MGRIDPKAIHEADEILAHIRALWRDLLRNPFAEAEEHGITGPQVTVMACLVRQGPMTVTELSRTAGMSHSTASGIVDRLETRGLVQRTEDAADRRRTRVTVTDRVTRYVRDLEAGPAGQLAAALTTVNPLQRKAIRRGLSLLRGALDAHRRNAPARRTPSRPAHPEH
jgi:MarR family transcriptional regulator, organic hydroperoxide resistance regulator